MERRIFLAALFMMAILLLNRMFAPPLQPRQPATQQGPAPAPAPGASEGPAGVSDTGVPPTEQASGTASEVRTPSVAAPAGAAQPEATLTGGWGDSLAVPRDVVVETDLFRAVFSTRGARLVSWQLKRFEGPESQGWVELIPPESEGGLGLSLESAGSKADLSTAVFRCDRDELRLAPGDPEAALTMSLSGPGGLELRRVMSFSGDSYSFGLDLQFLDSQGKPYLGNERARLSWTPGLEMTERNVGDELHYFGALASVPTGIFRASLSDFRKKPEPEPKEAIDWAALRNKYFLVAFLPRVRGGAQAGFSGDPERARISMAVALPPLAEYAGPAEGVPGPEATAHRGTARSPYHSGDVEIYLGPMEHRSLAAYGRALEQAVDLGWRWLRPLSRVTLLLMQQIHRVVPNWGLAIILLSVLTKIIFHPLTHKSVKSMREMQRIQPRLTEIREKYKNDPQRQQKEMMKLYREAGVNPLSGCLPMLVQSPVFMALFNVLQRTIELRNAGFMLWINDLSSPDVLFVLPFSLPGLGANLSLLPLLMGAGMFWQQRTSSPQGAADPRMKTMNVLMPIVFTFMFYRFPSGLVLYWLVNTLLTIGHQVLLNRGETVQPVVAEAPKKSGRRRSAGKTVLPGEGSEGMPGGGDSRSAVAAGRVPPRKDD